MQNVPELASGCCPMALNVPEEELEHDGARLSPTNDHDRCSEGFDDQ